MALELTLRERIVAHAQRAPRATAIAAPDRAPLSYGGLAEHVEYVVRSLGALGVRRGMRVATALPNGPELAVANVAISAAATCVPMNPALRAAELASYLQATRTDALIVQQGQFAAARDVARELSIRCIDVSVDQCDPAGIFRFAGAEPTGDPAYARPSEIALLMQTSGTTGDSPTPRLVPLTHENVFRSALHTRAALELQPVDRCLNVMPVFLIHGIVGATFSSLSAGASVVCVDQFDHLRFVDWLETFNPTWYTAVPAMHQAILEQLEQGGVRRVWPALRFVRSSSSPLSVDCLKRLENALGVPVIESYGMTEAASQIASNPLPPRTRKPGSVGVPCGPEVRILDPRGQPLGRGQRGEIVIRGPNVMHGYAGDHAATEEAFVDGWLRTGDEGFLDDDGYLFITGRLKEMINRGGEKILPAEVDDILRLHPAVHDAAAFGRPHPRLGEVVAAAVVLKAGMAVQPHELRSFAAERLVAPKVPHDVHFVATLPRSALGKLQRRVLARQLLTPQPNAAPADTQVNPTEHALRQVWSAFLKIPAEDIGPNDDFFLLGGDSSWHSRWSRRSAISAPSTFRRRCCLRHPPCASSPGTCKHVRRDSTLPLTSVQVIPRR